MNNEDKSYIKDQTLWTKTIEVTIPLATLQDDYIEIEYKLAHLLIESVIFCNDGWWKEEEKIPWEKGHTTLHVNCNDIFAWGCADSEDITHDEIHELYKMWKADPQYGPAIWCIKKRKEMPQKPVEDAINKTGLYDLKEIINAS